jgi:predicted membrane-bound spermidine synthase
MIQAKAAGITMVLSILTGMEYSLAFRLSGRNKALNVAKNYSADLSGSALGAFIIPVFLFPLLGMMNTGYLLALLNTAGAAVLFINRKNFVSL